MKRLTVADTLEMPPDERIALFEAIWDSIAEKPDSVPVSEAQRAELRRRLAVHEQDPVTTDWASVKKRILAR